MLCGISGGADSTALLHLLHAARIPVAAAHVNYGLRGEESDADEKFVSEFCAMLSIPLYVRKTSADELGHLNANLQMAAREIRYTFFNQVCQIESISRIAVAHHSNDQLETVLMNFLRGSGLRGMQGMQYRNGNIIRPLLDVSSSDIEAYLKGQNISWRSDSSNASDSYLRNRIRHHVIPAIHKNDDRKQLGWKHSIEQLTESNELLLSLLQTIEENITRISSGEIRISKHQLQQTSLPHYVLNHLLDKYEFGLRFSSDQFTELMKQQPGRKYLSGVHQLIVDREDLILTRNSSRKEDEITLEPGTITGRWNCSEIESFTAELQEQDAALIDAATIGGPLIIRIWRDGDRMQPFGFAGTKKVSDILTEMKIPMHEKVNFSIVTYNNDVVWIPGYRIADKFKITQKTKTALRISKT